MEHLLLI